MLAFGDFMTPNFLGCTETDRGGHDLSEHQRIDILRRCIKLS